MKMKKLLASALAAALVVSSMVGTIVTSAATKVGTITAETVNVTAGQTDSVEAEVNITFDKGVVAPHNFITVALAGYELTDVALGDVTYATDAQGKVFIDKDGCDLDAGKILIEAPVDATAPTVTAITLTVTFTDVDDVDTAAGEYDIVVNADDMSDVDEADLTLDAVNGKLIVAAAHEHDFVPTVTDPTCTEQGYTTFNCACGKDSYVGEYTDALGHNYVGEVTTAPDCDDAGVKTYTCSRCFDSYTEAINALGHTEVAIPPVDATCTEDGATAGTKCDVCDAIITAPTTIPATGHTAGDPVEENRVEAKPGVAGSYDSVVYCTVCKAEISRTTNEIPALPEVEVCDHEDKVFYTDETHSYVPATGTASSETSKGQIFFKCSDCDEIIEEEVSYYHYYATGNSNLALESEISAQFYLRDDHYNRQGTPTDAIIVLNKSNYGKAATDYVFKFAETKPATINGKAAYMANIGVAAKEMNDNISTYVFVEYNGEWYNGMSITKSIKIFAMDSITAATSASNPLTLKQLYANMLTYGSKAQVNYDYDTENLADAGLVGEYASLVNTEEPVIEDKGENPLLVGRDHVGFNSFSLVLGAKVEISIGYRTDFYKGEEVFGDLHPECTYTSVDGKELTWFTTNVTSTQANRYTFTFDGAAAKDMRQMIRFYVHNAEGPVGYYLDTSIETVARRLIDSNSNNTKLCNVVKAMIVYGDAAAAYFAG